MKDISSITAAKQGFEAAFAEKNLYARQTQDNTHLDRILDILPVKAGMRILDLGAGTGYLTFAIAKKYPDAQIIGLDIVEKTLENNNRQVIEQGLKSISFQKYDGVTFPFADNSFDMVVTRYALHHFPDISGSFAELSRIISDEGFLFISDPAPNEGDTSRFVDGFMQQKPDGHIRFYCAKEWTDLCSAVGFTLADSFTSTIRFPRKMSDPYRELIQKHDKKIVESYDIEIVGDEIFITEQVNNMLFCKAGMNTEG